MIDEWNIGLDGSRQIVAEKAITVKNSGCARYRYLAHVAEKLTCAITVCALCRGLIRQYRRFVRILKNCIRTSGISVLRKSEILRI